MSIIKPLKGLDEGLEDNLRSFFQNTLSKFEILFCVADPKDPAAGLVRSLIEKFPHVDARLCIAGVEIGQNPKVNNIAKAYQEAKYDLIWISDSNIRLDAGDMEALLEDFYSEDVGMLTAAVSGKEPSTFAGALEAMFLNTFYSRWMRITEAANKPCVIGKCMIFKKSTADRFGGLKVLARFLAEDYMAGVATQQLGLKVKVSQVPAKQILGKLTFRQFWERHIRWGRIRKAQNMIAYVLEPLSNSVVSGLIGAFAFNTLFGVDPLYFWLGHMSLYLIYDFLVYATIEPWVPISFPILWIVRELLSFPLWFMSLLGKTVNWRGRKIVVEQGGTISG